MKKSKLAFWGMLLAIVIALVCPGLALASNDIKIFIDGRQLITDVSPVIINGRTMLPLRVVFESLGLSVNWNGETKQVTGKKEGKTIIVKIDNPMATVDNQSIYLDAAPVIKNGRTLVPVRFVAEAVNSSVEWDSQARAVYIKGPFELSIDSEGNGTVKINNERDEYIPGTGVDLSAIPDSGWEFNGWDGDVENPNEADTYVIMDSHKIITARFKKKELKGPENLQEYLNTNYPEVETPAGTWKLSYTVTENDSTIFPMDYKVYIDWDSFDGISPYDLKYSTKISDADREESMELLTEFQRKIAKIAINALPNQKIEGAFYSGFYRYSYIRVGYESIRFLTWTNYEPYDGDYNEAEITEFHWYQKYDDYHFVRETYDEWNQSPEDTTGYDWINLQPEQKQRLFNKMLSIWQEENKVPIQTGDWFISKVDEYYQKESNREMDVKFAFDLAGIGDGLDYTY